MWQNVFHPILFIITLVGSVTAHLFSNMINDLWDYRNGADDMAKETPEAISTNSGFLTNKVLSERTFAGITWGLLAVAVVSGIVLTIYSGWPALLFGGLGGLIAYFYVAPPLRLGYRGKGFSEILIVISFGILPVMGTYYVQTQEISYQALMLSLPVGLLTTLLLFNHHFLHWQADKQAGKRTLVVVFGEKRALVFSRMLMIIGYLSVLLCVIVGVLPLYALLALLTVIPLYKVYQTLGAQNPSVAYLPLMGATQKASSRCGLVMGLALLIQGIFS